MPSVRPCLHTRTEGDAHLSTLVWRLATPQLAVSTASCGGGFGAVRWVVNAQVATPYLRTDIDDHAAEIATACALPGRGVTMLTAVDVRDHHVSVDDGVTVVATVGVTHAAPAAAPAEVDATAAGTINVVAIVPVPIAAGGMVNLVATITEAKCQAMADARIPGTGTPSDAVTVLCATGSEGLDRFGGPRSIWGARVARAAYDAIATGLAATRTPP